MDPADFHTFASRTLRGGRPVDCRVAIGRAYYAVFNVAAGLLRLAHCKIDDGPQGHGQAANFLLSVGSVPEVMDAGSWMRDAKGARNKADYKMDNKHVELLPNASLIVAEAGTHIHALRTAFDDPLIHVKIVADLDLYKLKMRPGYTPPTS